MWQNEEVTLGGPKIPQALEKILQLKEIRQEQLTDVTGLEKTFFPSILCFIFSFLFLTY